MTPINGNPKAFKDYVTKPQKRKALQITSEHNLRYDKWETRGYINTPQGDISFASYKHPDVGDYVVFLTKDDIYHVDKKTFETSYET